MSLMNTLKSLFGGKSGPDTNTASEARSEDTIEYKDCLISPAPIKEGSHYRTAGTISRPGSNADSNQSETGRLETQFIRADNHTSREQAVEHCVSKAKQIIDERGDKLFDSERC